MKNRPNRSNKNRFVYVDRTTLLPQRQVVGVFDLDSTTVRGDTRQYLAAAEEKGEVTARSGELPLSFIVSSPGFGRQRLRLTANTPATLAGRFAKPPWERPAEHGNRGKD